MRVKVDQLKCGTIGICVKECPQVFRFQPGSKKATVKEGQQQEGHLTRQEARLVNVGVVIYVREWVAGASTSSHTQP